MIQDAINAARADGFEVATVGQDGDCYGCTCATLEIGPGTDVDQDREWDDVATVVFGERGNH
jgi:hypothetical protein